MTTAGDIVLSMRRSLHFLPGTAQPQNPMVGSVTYQRAAVEFLSCVVCAGVA